eukprot:SAG31_NODE_1984_length_6740_cov_4.949255_3_plen_73_part_00
MAHGGDGGGVNRCGCAGKRCGRCADAAAAAAAGSVAAAASELRRAELDAGLLRLGAAVDGDVRRVPGWPGQR